MKAGNGNHFEQNYHAPAAVEVDSRLIVGERVSPAPNDNQELVPTLAAIPAEAGPLATALVDSGFFSEKAVTQVERAGAGPGVYAAMEKTGHHRKRGRAGKPPGTGTTRCGRESERSDAAPAQAHGGQAALQVAAANGRAGVRDYQGGAGLPAVSVAWAGESGVGMDAGLSGLQPETAASPGCGPETGDRELKRRAGSRKSQRGPVAARVQRRKITQGDRHR